MKNIKLMNKIAPVGIEVFDKNEYNVGEDVESPIGIMVRSADLQNAEFGHELRAIARAGAGVNNIPVARCAENGIVVFNTPGANANGVKELTVCALLLASRGIVEGVKWAQSLAGTEGIAKAVEKGTVTQEQADAMTEKEAIDLLFRPSFSTSEKITDVSGRGVGLDVVKSKIEALGGDVEVKTKYGEGSTFSIRLPLTLAIIQALMVKLGDEKYAISLGAIETIEDVPVTDIKYIHAKEVINLRGSVIPLIRLRDILDVPGEQEESDTITVVIVRKGDKLAGLVVDSLIGQMEIVIKSLGKYININRMISGATILGDGSVALIIDANTLV